MTASPRILLVEDLALHRRLMPIRLEALGKEVVGVANTDEAAAYLTEAKALPHLILMDVVMPGKDGFTYAGELKSDLRTRHIPIMMLTALKASPLERSLEVGADDFLPKNVDDGVLRTRVRLHLNLQELRMAQGGMALPERPENVLLATRSPLIRSTVPAQISQLGHLPRTVDRLEAVEEALRPGDRLLILDTNLDQDGVLELLARLRMDPATARLPILLLCEKAELVLLPAIETMVDDVLWKPLNAKVNRMRFQFLIELGRRSCGEA